MELATSTVGKPDVMIHIPVPGTTMSRSKPWVFGLVFMALSMALEIVLIVVVRLRVPQDNAIIAPILLTVSPIVAALICGYRRPRELILVTFLAVILTLLFVLVFGRITGISTGIAPPIVIRTLAGFLAAVVTNKVGNARAAKNATAG
jgi:hypothetical protein